MKCPRSTARSVISVICGGVHATREELSSGDRHCVARRAWNIHLLALHGSLCESVPTAMALQWLCALRQGLLLGARLLSECQC